MPLLKSFCTDFSICVILGSIDSFASDELFFSVITHLVTQARPAICISHCWVLDIFVSVNNVGLCSGLPLSYLES